jgi:DNA helicase-2/ATP-dependent DNA helicase PcrA
MLPGMTTRTEFGVKAALETGLVDFPEVLLTGNFDRIDSGTDGVAVRVVDYKTGKPKTRGEIEGTTKTSNGNYKRQLVFYALLLSLQSDERLKTVNTVLSFVEPDAKGVIHEEAFTITDDEIATLKAEIIEATRAVITGECLTVPCDPEVTDFCHLVERLR